MSLTKLHSKVAFRLNFSIDSVPRDDVGLTQCGQRKLSSALVDVIELGNYGKCFRS